MNRRDFLKTMGIGAASLALLGCVSTSQITGVERKRPNIVFIMTDNHGAWTLGCYGNKDIRTPNIDRLASEGILFTHCFSSNAVCSPTRATSLTGLIPSQHGVHCWSPRALPGQENAIGEFHSLPEILAESGYVCGITGKWHLGGRLHKAQEKFAYWVVKRSGDTPDFYNTKVIENGKLRIDRRHATDIWTEYGIGFIEQNKDRPFFLLLTYNGPYGLGPCIWTPARDHWGEYYADKEMKSFPREPMHPWLLMYNDSLNNIEHIRRYAAEVSKVDDGVGRIMDTLKRLGLDKNTLVIFTADQGLCGGHHGMWGMADHSRPLHTFDETMHIPMMYRHPAGIPAGKMSDLMVSNYDLMPTLLSYVGLGDRIPDEPKLPGRDYSAALRGERIDWDNAIYYEFENTRMIRTADWKYTRRFPDGPDELYDLKNDPGERRNLAGQAEYADIQKQLGRRLETFFESYVDPKYDLWRGGRSKSPRVDVNLANPPRHKLDRKNADS